MSFNYSGDPGQSDLDAVRFYAQDTNPDNPLLSDEELLFLIEKWTPINGSNIFTAAVACEVISAQFAREVTYSADGVSISASDLQDKYNNLASSLRDQWKSERSATEGPDVGGILYGEELDQTIKPLIWAKGMNDNYRAGQQDYGGDAYAEPQPPWEGGPQ